MESVIKKIFAGITDEEVHSEFVKFSKGVFDNKYLVEIKKQKDRFSIKTSSEFANFLVRRCLEDVKEPLEITGAIISTLDMKNEISFPIEKIKQFMGIKQILINSRIAPDNIISLMNKFPKAFYALSFKTNKCELKIKAKAQKSSKPSASGEKEPKADFCSLKTSDKSIVNDLTFGCSDFSEFRAKHIIKINEIKIPKNEKEPAKIRELAIRKGVMTRKIIADGKEILKEASFEI